MLAACSALAAGILCGVIGHAKAADTDNEMIVNGQEAPDGKYPYQVRLYKSTTDDHGFCGGSLIAAQWVLTASHCLAEKKGSGYVALTPDEVVIGYGSNDRTKTKRVLVDKVIVHPNYLANGQDGKADVALLKLKTSVPSTKIVPLADPDADKKYLVSGAEVIITGWGNLWSYNEDIGSLMSEIGPDMDEKLRSPIRLREVQIPVVDNASCSAVFANTGHATTIADTEFCLMQKGSTKDSCQGDSGGPLVVARDDNKGFLQVGVVSWGRGCGGDTPGVYARVGSFNGWIADMMKSN